MKSSSTFVQGLCAGVLLTLFMLLFAAGSARGQTQQHIAAPQTFTLVLYATAKPSLRAVKNQIPTMTAPAASPMPTVTATLPVRERVQEIKDGEWQAFSDHAVLTTTLANYFAPDEICLIQQNVCPFSYLVGNLDPGIVFPALTENASAPSRLMHPAMLKPLANLRASLFNRWPGRYALVVLKAYAPGARGLSAQGQTAEITLSPKPSDADLAQFCGMAFRAGFDWVGNEGIHCRVAVRAVPLCAVCQPTTPVSTPVVLISLITPMPSVSPTTAPSSVPVLPPSVGGIDSPHNSVTPIP
jgi:hypothetical protein